MDHPDEINYDISKYIQDIDPLAVQMIRFSERVKIFTKLRNLIYEKEYDNDEVAAHVLGWAYEKLGDS
jgi:hypothetical protein